MHPAFVLGLALLAGPDPAALCQDAADSLACAELVEPRILEESQLARREAPDVRYRLFGCVARAGLWIVLGRWQDGERWYVVDRGAGTVAAFPGVPQLSPDATRVAESPSWTGPGGRGLRIWRLAYPAPVLEFSVDVAEDPLSLEPAFMAPRWSGDTVLAFVWQVPVEGCKPSCYRNAPGKLTRRPENGWRLDGMPEGWPSSVRLSFEPSETP